jgi:hypothetical protein
MLAPIDRTIIDQHLRHDAFQSLQYRKSCTAIAAHTRNRLRNPFGRTRPKVFSAPRKQFFMPVTCDPSFARTTSRARTACLSIPFTPTSRYQPTRMICASW